MYNGLGLADRNKETGRSICSVKGLRKELEPRVIPIHDNLPSLLCLHLCQPCILCSERGRSVWLCEIQDHIEERWYRASCDCLYSRHGNCRRCSMRSERDGCSAENETAGVILAIWIFFRILNTPLRKCKSRVLRIDKVTALVSSPLKLHFASYLLSASTTMKMTLSNGASGGGPYSKASYWANPERNGL